MNKKLVIALVAVLVVIGLGVGTFFIIKTISDENHKKDIEMAADCAKSFDMPYRKTSSNNSGSLWNENEINYNLEISNNRISKRQECAEKYHVTHQEIIDKIGTDVYFR